VPENRIACQPLAAPADRAVPGWVRAVPVASVVLSALTAATARCGSPTGREPTGNPGGPLGGENTPHGSRRLEPRPTGKSVGFSRINLITLVLNWAAETKLP